ncbi:oxidative damage protection protein [Candidatus Pantoea edessiphila]|uniref:Probable Fe(2+)-trafficking protein n=1 Tax=Candidatus Pantoea edessiphila TaxID=2044610 RepID=A0A2P5SVW6_9GAMM|nr:oxidative damage protection protein [Candidatus Pantoea edessiphila]PPI86464.1 oxidative damage protection protein [Candidatus Pantoea edessiphila]
MNRIIFCSFLRCESEGQEYQVYPGDIGKRIYNEISKKAWKLWIEKQTILINEKKLNLINQKDRKILEDEMIKFLFKSFL